MLGKAHRHLDVEPIASADARHVHFKHIAALQRVLEGRLPEPLVDGAQQEGTPCQATTCSLRHLIDLHRSDEAIGRRKVEMKVDTARHAAEPSRWHRRLYRHAQPQPVLPSCLASTSATQQASALAGAGPPQQPLATSAWFVRGPGPEQTPVSGSTSSTVRAASWSPAISAAIERTCS